MAHRWPGNVRELENTIHRALVLTTDNIIGPAALEVERPMPCSPPGRKADLADATVSRPLNVIEREAIIDMLQLTGGNRPERHQCLGCRYGRFVTRSTCTPRRV